VEQKLLQENYKRKTKMENQVTPVTQEEIKEIIADDKSGDGLFINEDTTFTAEVEYYIENGVLFVKDVDNNFDVTKACKKLIATFKYPSFYDAQNIFSIIGSDVLNTSNVMELIKIQDVRMTTLLRSWNVDKPISEFQTISTKISKALRAKVNEVLGMEGIF